MLRNRLEILMANHLEHFKIAKDLAMIYSIDHPKRLLLQKVLKEMVDEMQELNKLIEEDENKRFNK